MVKKKRLFISWLILALFSFNFCSSQESVVLLKDKLNEIEATKGVLFNYASSLIENVYVSDLQESDLSLEQQFHIYTKESGFIFEFLDNMHVVVKRNYDIVLQLVDKKNDLNLVANVVLTDPDSGNIWYTNKFGKVFLKTETLPNSLEVFHPSFDITIISLERLGDNKNPIIELERKILQLDQVNIKAYLTSGILQNTSGNFIIKPKKSEALPGLVSHDIMRSLQNLPHLYSTDESMANLSVKGGSNDQNLTLWNGVKMYQNSHFFGLISSFNYNLVNYVSLYDNATPANMGGSTSSTIKIDSKDKLSKTFKGGVGLSLISTEFYNHIPIGKKSNILISGRRGLTDLFRSPTYQGYSKKAFQNSNLDAGGNTNIEKFDHFLFYDFELHYLLNFNEKNKFRLHTIYFKNALSHLQTIVSQDQTRESLLDQRSYAIGLNWQRKFSERFNGKFSYGLSDYDLFAENRTYVFNLNNEQFNKITSHNFQLDFDYRFKDDYVFLFGAAYEHLAVNNLIENKLPSFYKRVLDINETPAVYAQVNHYGEKLSYGAGMRAMYYSKLKKQRVEPRAYVKYAVNDVLTLQARGEMKSQYLSQDIDLENNFLGVEKRRWHLANDTLYKMQTSKQVDLGVGYKPSKRWSMYATAYLKQVKGINTFSQGFQNQNLFQNHFGAYNTKGFTFHSNLSDSGKVVWLSYTYALNDYNFESLSPSKFRNNLDVRHRLIVGGKIDIKPFSIVLGMEYKTGAPYTGINEAVPIDQSTAVPRINYDMLNQKELPDYLRFDASVMCGVNLSKGVKGKITLGFINVTGRKNIVNRLYRINDANSQSYSEINLNGLGLTPNISLKIDY